MKKTRVTYVDGGNELEFWGEEHDDHIRLTRYKTKDVKKIHIPEFLLGKPVTVIGRDCFFNHSELLSVDFPKTLTHIECGAFMLCKGITELVFPDGITVIDEYAFRDCTGLTKIVLPANLKCLKHGIFSFCYLSEDAEIVLNEGLEVIEQHVFYSSVSSNFTVRIPKSVKSIAKDAFDPAINVIYS